MVTGKDLIAMGYVPGKWFKNALSYINGNGLEGKAMIDYLDGMKPPPVMPLNYGSIPYFENIKADNEIEQDNIDSVRRSMELLMQTPTIVQAAVMPDACPTGARGAIPVGGVAVAHKAIHPGMHSADICCSVMLTSFGKVDPKTVLDMAQDVTHFGPGGRSFSKDFVLDAEIFAEMKANPFLNSPKMLQLAQEHLGTQGDGNHFLYVGISKKTGETVMVTHHGSRGVGAMLYKTGMRIAEHYRKKLSPDTLPSNAWIPSDTSDGEMYWKALQTVRKWTKFNHESIHGNIGKKLGYEIKDRFWNEHNFVFKDGDLFYHAKGATPMDAKFMPDVTGPRIIPLNMAEPILIAEGGTTANNLGFAPHGAGRNMSRSKHKATKAHRTIEEVFAEETQAIDARFYSGIIDISELPSAYKNAAQVKQQIEDFGLAKIVDEIMPYGCIMAGDWESMLPWKQKKEKG